MTGLNRTLSALAAGLVFGLGLTISEMVNPAKVRAFLDVFGNWDPSLAFVMGAGLIVTFAGYRLVLKRSKPVFDNKFRIPQSRELDAKLILGAILFGAGWGLVGLCPGPAIAALSFGGIPILVFLAALIAGMAGFEALDRFVFSRT